MRISRVTYFLTALAVSLGTLAGGATPAEAARNENTGCTIGTGSTPWMKGSVSIGASSVANAGISVFFVQKNGTPVREEPVRGRVVNGAYEICPPEDDPEEGWGGDIAQLSADSKIKVLLTPDNQAETPTTFFLEKSLGSGSGSTHNCLSARYTNSKSPVCTNNLVFIDASENVISFHLKDKNSNSLEFGNWQLYQDRGNGEISYLTGNQTSEEGIFSLSNLSDGGYQLDFENEVAVVGLFDRWRLQVSDSGTAYTLQKVNTNNNSAYGEEVLPTENTFYINAGTPNVNLSAYLFNADDTTDSQRIARLLDQDEYSGVEDFRKVELVSEATGTFQSSRACSSYESVPPECVINGKYSNDGKIRMLLSDGFYFFEWYMNLGRNQAGNGNSFVIEVLGGDLGRVWQVTTHYRNEVTKIQSSKLIDSNLLVEDGDAIALPIQKAFLTGAISYPASLSKLKESTWLDVNVCHINGCDNELNINLGVRVSSNQDGQFAISKLEYGETYLLTLNLQSFSVLPKEKTGQTKYSLKVSANGDVSISNLNPFAPVKNLNINALPLDAANVVGAVYLPGTGTTTYKKGTYVQAYKLNQDGTINSDISQNWSINTIYSGPDAGSFYGFLPDGNYRLSFSPDNDNAYSLGTMEVTISSGQIQSTIPAEAKFGSILRARLTTPNLFGTVYGDQDIPLAWSGMSVSKFLGSECGDDESENCGYEHLDNNPNVDRNGKFTTNLSAGQYHLRLHSPSLDFVSTQYEIGVQSNGLICFSENGLAATNWSYATLTCSSPLPKNSNIDLYFQKPNISGYVTAGEKLVSPHVEFRNISSESNRGNYIDIEAQELGNFSARVTQPGIYLIRKSGPGDNTLKFSSGYEVIRAEENSGQIELCVITDIMTTDDLQSVLNANSENPFALDLAPECDSTVAQLEVVIELEPTLVNIKVVDLQGYPVPNAEVELNLPMGDPLGGQSNSDGYVYLNLPAGASSEEKMVIDFRINPSDQSNDLLSSLSREICFDGEWLYSEIDFATDAGEKIWGPNGWVVDDCTSLIGSEFEIDETTTYSFALGQGNIIGEIQDADGLALTSQDAWIEISKQNAQGQWSGIQVEVSPNANRQFALDLDEGKYRFVARPYTWRNNAIGELAETTYYLKVESDLTWCQVSKDDSTCLGEIGDNIEGDGLTGFSLQIKEPSIRGNLLDLDGNGVPWASIEVVEFDPAQVGNYWYSGDYIASNGTGRNGAWGLLIEESGSYALRFSSWNRPDLPRFEVKFETLCDSRGECEVTSGDLPELNDNGRYSISFPAPNFTGRVCSAESNIECIGIRDSWLQVEKEMTDPNNPENLVWQWTNQGTSTGRSGIFNLLLEEGKYRLTANPSWNRGESQGVTRTFEVNVDSEGAATYDPTVDFLPTIDGVDIRLQSANISGVVQYLNDPADSSSLTNMRYAWVVAYKENYEYVASASTNGDGEYQMYLPDGDYIIWAYPNWGEVQRAPIQVRATVSTDEDSNIWAYARNSSENPEFGHFNLDAVPANVILNLQDVIGKRVVKVFEKVGVSYETRSQYATLTSGFENENSVKLTLPVGEYKIEVLPMPGETTWGYFEFEVVATDDGNILEQTLGLDSEEPSRFIIVQDPMVNEE